MNMRNAQAAATSERMMVSIDFFLLIDART
jgi:hypothetical protein